MRPVWTESILVYWGRVKPAFVEEPTNSSSSMLTRARVPTGVGASPHHAAVDASFLAY